jgi:23S rRNA (pseudouridine1915-N3)-methyltransferase
MKIHVVAVGRMRNGPLREVCDDYIGRLKRYGPAEIIEVKPADDGDVARRVAQEAERVLGVLAPGDQVVALDERGKQMSSVELSELLKTLELRAIRRAVFIIGGAYGLSDEVRKKGILLSLSKMTLPHELCRAVVLEQLYRARTIQNGEPYHHA